VDENSFGETKSTLSNDLAAKISAKFGVNWRQVEYDDLVKPLHSGIAARLKIDAYYKSRTSSIPQSVSQQASFWASSYTVNTWTNAVSVFVDASAVVDSDGTCRSHSDNENTTISASSTFCPYK